MAEWLYLSLLQGMHSHYKSEAFTADVLWLQTLSLPLIQSYHALGLKLFEFSSMGAAPARPQGVCLSVFFFVHHVWQIVAWDTCFRINLQGLVVYEEHHPLWQSALCS